MKANKLKKGSILSETSFYVVKEVQTKAILVEDDMGNEITIGNPYVEKVLQSGDYYEKEEQKNMTDLADIFVNSPRVAQSVCFITKDAPKTKKDYNTEIDVAVEKLQNAKVSDFVSLLTNLIENPIPKNIPGEERIMRGRHYGQKDDLGRVAFIDMEVKRDPSLNYDSRTRKVDPRTIQWIIVNKVKYTLKK